MASDLAFTINPSSRKLDVATRAGSPYYEESRLHKVMSRLSAVRGRWWADSTGAYGSRLREVKNLRRTTPGDLESYAREALAPLVTAGEILPPRGARQITVEVSQFNRQLGRAVIFVAWVVPGGAEQSTRYPLGF